MLSLCVGSTTSHPIVFKNIICGSFLTVSHPPFSACVLYRLFRRFWGPTNSSALNWESTVCRLPGLSGQCHWLEAQFSKHFKNVPHCIRTGFNLPSSSCFSLYYRSVFKDNHGALDRESRFSPLFKQESNKISTDDLIKLVTEYRR